jgi:hypothetical protein
MIDYDGTYGADIAMFRETVDLFLLYGHKIYLVTSRDYDTPVELAQDFVSRGIPIVYCSYRAKRTVCEAQGIKIDIWIDNDPYYIDNGFINEVKPIREKSNGV